MASLLEASQSAGAGSGLAADLIAAVDQISEHEQFTFTLYREVILPIDGFRFWCLASSLLDSGSALYNNRRAIGRRAFNATPGSAPPLTPVQQARYTFTAGGSLHVTQSIEQATDNTIARQQIVFTSPKQIRELEDVKPGALYFMTLPDGGLAAFSTQLMRYNAAGIWHYRGVALLPFEASQVVQSPATLLQSAPIVSNSLPLWLEMGTPEVPIYPAMLSPLNFEPPYVTADVQSTLPLALAPRRGQNSSQSQLVTDTIRFTFFGLRNDAVLDFQQMILDNSFAGDYGVMNSPVPVDDQRPQADFAVIAQQKTMDLQVNYYQQRTRNIARRLIESAFITITAN